MTSELAVPAPADTPPVPLNLFQRIRAVMQDLPYLQKKKGVQLGGRDVKTLAYEDLVTEVQPLLIKHGIVVLSSMLSKDMQTLESERTYNGETKTVVTTVCTVVMGFQLVNADDPAERTEMLYFPGMGYDTSDKAMGKATTYAAKDFFRKTFVVPTGVEEPEDDDHERPPAGRRPAAVQGQQPDRYTYALESLKATTTLETLAAAWKPIEASHRIKPFRADEWQRLKDHTNDMRLALMPMPPLPTGAEPAMPSTPASAAELPGSSAVASQLEKYVRQPRLTPEQAKWAREQIAKQRTIIGDQEAERLLALIKA